MDEAVEFVASALPDDVSARLTYEDVEALLGWHVVHLAGRDGEVDIADDEVVADLVAHAAADGRAITRSTSGRCSTPRSPTSPRSGRSEPAESDTAEPRRLCFDGRTEERRWSN